MGSKQSSLAASSSMEKDTSINKEQTIGSSPNGERGLNELAEQKANLEASVLLTTRGSFADIVEEEEDESDDDATSLLLTDSDEDDEEEEEGELLLLCVLTIAYLCSFAIFFCIFPNPNHSYLLSSFSILPLHQTKNLRNVSKSFKMRKS